MTLHSQQEIVLKVVRRAASLVRDGWTRMGPARNNDGELVHEFSREATSFTMYCAIRRAAHDLTPAGTRWRYIVYVACSTICDANSLWVLHLSCNPESRLMGWENCPIRSKADCLAALEHTIRHLQQQEVACKGTI